MDGKSTRSNQRPFQLKFKKTIARKCLQLSERRRWIQKKNEEQSTDDGRVFFCQVGKEKRKETRMVGLLPNGARKKRNKSLVGASRTEPSG